MLLLLALSPLFQHFFLDSVLLFLLESRERKEEKEEEKEGKTALLGQEIGVLPQAWEP